MIKTFIVDDEQHSRAMMRMLLEKRLDVQILGESETVYDAMNKIINLRPDLLFLDIKMPGMTGFEMIDELVKMGMDKLDIVFLTAYNEYAIQAIKYSAFDYLLKPIDEKELETTLNRFKVKHFLNLAEKQKELSDLFSSNRIYKIKSNEGYNFVDFEDIIYIEGDSNYSIFMLKNGRIITSCKTLKVIMDELPIKDFIRIHKSYLVNVQYLKNYNSKDKVCLLGINQIEFSLPVSSRMLKNLMEI